MDVDTKLSSEGYPEQSPEILNRIEDLSNRNIDLKYLDFHDQEFYEEMSEIQNIMDQKVDIEAKPYLSEDIVYHFSDQVIPQDLKLTCAATACNEDIKREMKDDCNIDPKCKRTIFITSEENSYSENPEFVKYIQTSKVFHQVVDKCFNNDLPRKKIIRHWDALESVVVVQNTTIEKAFNDQKKKFASEGKVDKYGKVPEYFQFHGTAFENINKIIEENFKIDMTPTHREKAMLFGRGIYLSELPGVSLMYGEGLLLCKVILGKCQKYYPNGQPPPPIPEGFDSRIVVKDGLEVVTVVKKASQILPYSIINIKQDRIKQMGTLKTSININSTSKI